uniref:Putative receptor mediating netrin-dependent axon guidance n=1 Tax=Nyssomyia neivai TaxID=330878 RepID=A0A1L8DJY9_9DIPT
MALSFVRLCAVFTFGLFLTNGFLSVFAFINKDGPGPRLSFAHEPPPLGVVSRKSPLLLPCTVNFTRDFSYVGGDINYDGDEDNYDDVDDGDEGLNTNNYEDNPKFSLSHRNAEDFANFVEIKSTYDSSVINDEDNDAKEDTDDDFDGFRFRRQISVPSFSYVWYRNGEIVVEQNHNFRIFPNGTLKIFYSDYANGIYRCLVNDTKSIYGAIISRESKIFKTEFTRGSNETSVLVEMGSPLVLNCPFSSTPRANVTWHYKSKNILSPTTTDAADNRFFQLQNGSLLIVNTMSTDSGKYKCIAKNEYLQKSERIFMPQVTVLTSRTNHRGLFPALQEMEQKIIAGDTMELFCVTYNGEKVEWSFTPRTSMIPIKLSGFKYELKYKNVSREQHEGVYNCSTGASYQLYNVTVLIAPTFEQNLSSVASTMGASVTLSCIASGSPQPQIVWYHNGRLLENSHAIHYDAHELRLQSIEPEDEGIYQCFAKNDAGEIQMSANLSLRKRKKLSRLYNVKCYPVNYTTVRVQFDSIEPIHMVNYYLATVNPYTWLSPRPLEIRQNNTVIIVGEMHPLKAYTLYIRGHKKDHIETIGKHVKTHMLMGRLSKGVKCATQGLEIFSTPFPTGIFIWWPHVKDLPIESFKIQFRHSDTKNPIVFSDQIIGTTCELDEYRTWQEIESNLTKIGAETSIVRHRRDMEEDSRENANSPIGSTTQSSREFHHNEMRTEVLIPGNVTGILIPNSSKIEVRVLGATPDNPIEEQDLHFIPWKMIENSPDGVSQLRVNTVNAKSVQLSWNSFGPKHANSCLKLCFRNINQDVLIRGGKTDECQMINANSSSVEVKSLPPFTKYRMYLSNCNSSQPITDVIYVQTHQDVPGPVTKHRLTLDDGITLHWGPPVNPNGVLQYYSIVWNRNQTEMSANVSINENTFKLPNVTAMERINITIRAVGSAGIGIPIYVNLPGENNEKVLDRKESSTKAKFLGIIIGVCLSVAIVLIFGVVFVKFRSCTKNRQSGTNHNANVTYDQSLHPCGRDTHEMQTLIPQLGITTTTTTIAPNGNAKHGILDSFTESETRHENGGHVAINSSPRVSRGAKGGGRSESSRDVSDESENTLRMDECEEVVSTNGGNMHRMNGTIKTLNTQQHSTQILPPNQQMTPINNNVHCNGRNLHDVSVDSIDMDDSQQQLLGHTKNTKMPRITDRCADIKYHNGTTEIQSTPNGHTKCDDTYNWIVNNVAAVKGHPNNDHAYRRPIVGPNG